MAVGPCKVVEFCASSTTNSGNIMNVKLSVMAVLLAHAAAHAEYSITRTYTTGFTGSATVQSLQGVTLREPLSQVNDQEVLSVEKREEAYMGEPQLVITPATPGVDGQVELVRVDEVFQNTLINVRDSFEVSASLETSLQGQKLLALQVDLTRGDSRFKGANAYLSVAGSYQVSSLAWPGGVTLPITPVLPSFFWRPAGGGLEALSLTSFSRLDDPANGLGTFETYGAVSLAFDQSPIEFLVAAGSGVSLSSAWLTVSESTYESSHELLRTERVVMSSAALPALPVPEANTTVLALAGAGLVVAVTRRRRQS
jgi:hypothetical protein